MNKAVIEILEKMMELPDRYPSAVIATEVFHRMFERLPKNIKEREFVLELLEAAHIVIRNSEMFSDDTEFALSVMHIISESIKTNKEG